MRQHRSKQAKAREGPSIHPSLREGEAAAGASVRDDGRGSAEASPLTAVDRTRARQLPAAAVFGRGERRSPRLGGW